MQRIMQLLKQYQKKIVGIIILLSLGISYYLITQFTSFRIPCPFQTITGFACPGCGVSHFCIRLFHLDIIGAAKENFALAILLPLGGILFLIRQIWHPHWLAKNGTVEKVLLILAIIFLLLFGILRNLSGMEWMLPSYRQG